MHDFTTPVASGMGDRKAVGETARPVSYAVTKKCPPRTRNKLKCLRLFWIQTAALTAPFLVPPSYPPFSFSLFLAANSGFLRRRAGSGQSALCTAPPFPQTSSMIFWRFDACSSSVMYLSLRSLFSFAMRALGERGAGGAAATGVCGTTCGTTSGGCCCCC